MGLCKRVGGGRMKVGLVPFNREGLHTLRGSLCTTLHCCCSLLLPASINRWCCGSSFALHVTRSQHQQTTRVSLCTITWLNIQTKAHLKIWRQRVYATETLDYATNTLPACHVRVGVLKDRCVRSVYVLSSKKWNLIFSPFTHSLPHVTGSVLFLSAHILLVMRLTGTNLIFWLQIPIPIHQPTSLHSVDFPPFCGIHFQPFPFLSLSPYISFFFLQGEGNLTFQRWISFVAYAFPLPSTGIKSTCLRTMQRWKWVTVHFNYVMDQINKLFHLSTNTETRVWFIHCIHLSEILWSIF